MPRSQQPTSNSRGSACAECHVAKVKCDRSFPCSRCVRLGRECVPHESRQGKRARDDDGDRNRPVKANNTDTVQSGSTTMASSASNSMGMPAPSALTASSSLSGTLLGLQNSPVSKSASFLDSTTFLAQQQQRQQLLRAQQQQQQQQQQKQQQYLQLLGSLGMLDAPIQQQQLQPQQSQLLSQPLQQQLQLQQRQQQLSALLGIQSENAMSGGPSVASNPSSAMGAYQQSQQTFQRAPLPATASVPTSLLPSTSSAVSSAPVPASEDNDLSNRARLTKHKIPKLQQRLRQQQEQLNGSTGTPLKTGDQSAGAKKTKKDETSSDEEKEEAAGMSAELTGFGKLPKGHYGLRYLLRSWISIAFRRRSFALLARACNLATKCGIEMDELWNHEMQYLQSFLFLPQVIQLMVTDDDLLYHQVPIRLWKATGCWFADSSQVTYNTHPSLTSMNNRWIWVREMINGVSRYFTTTAFSRDLATTQEMRETFRKNEVPVIDLFLDLEGLTDYYNIEKKPKGETPSPRSLYTRGVAHQVSVHPKPGMPLAPCRQSGMRIRLKTQRNQSLQLASGQGVVDDRSVVEVDEISCIDIVDVDHAFYFCEYVPRKSKSDTNSENSAGTEGTGNAQGDSTLNSALKAARPTNSLADSKTSALDQLLAGNLTQEQFAFLHQQRQLQQQGQGLFALDGSGRAANNQFPQPGAGQHPREDGEAFPLLDLDTLFADDDKSQMLDLFWGAIK
jgi:Fungal Zn(2)-Cys(6) binuclear cluster domain